MDRFPKTLMQAHGYKDIWETSDASFMKLVNDVRLLQHSSNKEDIDKLMSVMRQIKSDPEYSKYFINADTINFIEEEIQAIERYAKSAKQQIYYEEEPDFSLMSNGAVWIGGI